MDQKETMIFFMKLFVNLIIFFTIGLGFSFFIGIAVELMKKEYKIFTNPSLYIYLISTAIIILLFTLLKGYSECSSNKTTIELYKERAIRLANFFYIIPSKIIIALYCIYFLVIYLYWLFSFFFEIVLPKKYYQFIFAILLLTILKSTYILQLFLGFIVYYNIKKWGSFDKQFNKKKADNSNQKNENKAKRTKYNNTKTILLIIILVISTLILFFFDNGLYFIYNKIYPEDIIDYSDKNNIGFIVYIFLIIVCLYLFELFKKYLDKSSDNKSFYVGFRDWGDFPGISFIKGWDIKQPIVQIFTTILKITLLFCSSPFISVLITSLYYFMNLTLP